MDEPIQLILILGFVAFSLFCFAFWLWMLVHALVKEPSGSDKIVWVIVIVLLPVIGSLIYFFVRVLGRREAPRIP